MHAFINKDDKKQVLEFFTPYLSFTSVGVLFAKFARNESSSQTWQLQLHEHDKTKELILLAEFTFPHSGRGFSIEITPTVEGYFLVHVKDVGTNEVQQGIIYTVSGYARYSSSDGYDEICSELELFGMLHTLVTQIDTVS